MRRVARTRSRCRPARPAGKQVGDRAAEHLHLGQPDRTDSGEVLRFGDRAAHDVFQRNRFTPFPARLATAEDDQVLRVAPRSGRQVVKLEQSLQVLGVTLLGLGDVEYFQHPVHHHLAAVGDVEEHVPETATCPGLRGG